MRVCLRCGENLNSGALTKALFEQCTDLGEGTPAPSWARLRGRGMIVCSQCRVRHTFRYPFLAAFAATMTVAGAWYAILQVLDKHPGVLQCLSGRLYAQAVCGCLVTGAIVWLSWSFTASWWPIRMQGEP